jgi:predicted lipoprotein with Yx(FWY)xxD motif
MRPLRSTSAKRARLGAPIVAIGLATAAAGCGSSMPGSTPAVAQKTPAVAQKTPTLAQTARARTATTTATKPPHATHQHRVTHRKAQHRHAPAKTTPPTKTANKTATTTVRPAVHPTTRRASPTGVVVDARSSSLGTILVGSTGRTLYLFEADKDSRSTCYGSCATVWPPLTTKGTPRAGSGIKPSLLGTTKRTDGTTEVTYNGHPLYYYVADSSPGQTTGQGRNQFGALWFVLSPLGSGLK